MRIRAFLERDFEFEILGTNWRTEILAGVASILTGLSFVLALFIARFVYLGAQ